MDAGKEELILELMDSPYTIPVRVHADFAKIVERAEKKEATTAVPAEGEEAKASSFDELDDEDSFWSRPPDED